MGGGIFDSDATERHRDIGYEINASLSWQILSDLKWTLQYGHFEPGKAYPTTSNDSEDYLSIDLTYTF